VEPVITIEQAMRIYYSSWFSHLGSVIVSWNNNCHLIYKELVEFNWAFDIRLYGVDDMVSISIKKENIHMLTS
jgi:hypothetical protein